MSCRTEQPTTHISTEYIRREEDKVADRKQL